MRWLNLSWLVVFVGTLFFAEPVLAAVELELDEDESMIVELRLGSYMLADAMVVYHSNDYTIVSLQEFLDNLEFAIAVDSETQQASGWFIHPKNTFSLNIKTHEVYIRGQKETLPDDFPFYADEFDLYVDIEYLKRWFGIGIDLQMARLIMQISTQEPLPIEQRVAREKLRSKNGPKISHHQAHPWIDDDYAWLGPPSLDVRLNAAQYESVDQTMFGYSLQSTSDVLKHETRISHIQTDQNTPTSTRLTFAKQASRPGASLGLGLTHYELGDIYARGDSLVSQGAPGVGVNVERYLSAALDQSFNRRDFEGDAPPGWEVELYRNGLFIDFQVVNESGRYIFSDVELQYGENFFEITRYGPQGQIEVERKRIQIGQEMITPGEWQFSATILNNNDQLIGEPILPSAQTDSEGKAQSLALTSLYGIREQHSLGLGFNKLPPSSGDDAREYARLIWISAYPLFSTRMDYAQDLAAGQATSLNLTGRMFKQDMNIETIYFQDFISEQSNYGNIRQKNTISLFGNIQAFKLRQMPYSFAVNQIETADGLSRLNLENRLSVFFGRNRLSNELTSSTTDSEGSQSTQRGVLSFNRASGALQFRTNVAYTLSPKAVTNASLTIDYRRVDWHIQLSTGAARSESLEGKNNIYGLGLNVSKTLGDMALGLSSMTDFKEATSIALTLDIGLKGQTLSPYVDTARYGASDMGTLEAKVFLDENANGRFDPDEQPLNNIAFKGRSAWQDKSTNKDGIVVLNGMDTTLGSVVTLDTVTLNDPYLQPTQASFRVASHAGAYRKIEVPVTEITEVEGYVLLVKNNHQKPVAGATVALYKNGQLIARTTTEFDGYYLFPNIPPGEYSASLVDENGGMAKYSWQPTPLFQTDIETGVTKVKDILVTENE